MTLYPEVQIKAQEEIDRVVGQDRLPDFSDRGNLPYVECVLLETLRWYPILPLGKHLHDSEEIFYRLVTAGVPHLTRMDDVFDGMYIPKGNPRLIFCCSSANVPTSSHNCITKYLVWIL